MKEMETKKDGGKRLLFSQIVVISRFNKTPGSYTAKSLKRKRCKKLIVQYLNL